MTPTLMNLIKGPAAALEAGMSALQSALDATQKKLDQIVTQDQAAHLTQAPIQGPSDIDNALSDFAARAVRIVRYAPYDTAAVPAVSQELVAAAKKSFGYLDLKNPRNILFPAQLAVSASSLMAQSALRGLATFQVLGPVRIQPLIKDFVEMFTELPVFLGLEYKQVIERCRARLAEHPEDDKTRYELGQTLVKCGLYDQAEKELLAVSKESSYYADAVHEATVALYRAGRLERAARAGVLALQARPGHARTKSWLWLTAKKMGGYPDYVPESARINVTAGYAKPSVQFVDIAAKIGLDKTSAGRGIAIFDYDNDGYLDVLVAAAHGGCNFYHNNGDGTFTDVSIGTGMDTCVNGFAVTVGDYNNDGFTDVFVTRLGFYGGECQLFRNNGNGTFTDVTKEAGLKVWGPAFAAAWIDYDCDGNLDLYIANNLGGLFERKTPNRLFHNNGDGTFTEVSEKVGLGTQWPSNCGAWGDYNNDGYPDLFVSNGIGRSQLYRNNRDGTFTDVSKEAGIDKLCFGSPAFWWDFDNDGWLDIGQFAWSDHEDVIHTMEHGEGPADGNPMRVYKNNRDGTFTDVGREIGFTGCWGTMSGNCGDFNNDGNLDVVLGNGSPKMDRMDLMVVMENDGKNFHNITFSSGFPFLGKSHGVNMADLFGDGRLSVLVAAGGAYPGDLLTTNVFCPTELPGNYLNVRLKGVKSNRSAIGARVILHAAGKQQMRELSGGSNFGCLPFEQHFGLAKIDAVESVEVWWPSGLKQTFTDLPINNTVEFVEGESDWVDVYQRARARKQSETKAIA